MPLPSDQETENNQDFEKLNKKLFTYIGESLVARVTDLIKRGELLSLFSLKKRAQHAKIVKKFKRIPASFIAVFDQESYLYANEDVRLEIETGRFDNALEHFILFGYDEVKEGGRRLGNELPFMSETDYMKVNPDVETAVKKGSFSSGFQHLLAYGYEDIRNKARAATGAYPFALSQEQIEILKGVFDERAYIKLNEDVEEAIEEGRWSSPWEQFFEVGMEEVRRGERILYKGMKPFSAFHYVMANNDVFDALKQGKMGSPYLHFLFSGANEIRSGARRMSLDAVKYHYSEAIFTKNIQQKMEAFKLKPLISVVVPVYNVDVKWLELAIRSLREQWYDNWEICIADDASTKEETVAFLKGLDDPKIKIVFLEENVNISRASNAALEQASGEYIALMDNDDELTPDALYEVVKVINETNAEFIYSDEDKLEPDNSYSEPHFKADYAPDMFLSQNYLSHLGVIKKSIVDDVGGWTVDLEGAQDYDLYLKVLERTDKIVHIPRVLYHWRKIPGSTAAVFSDKSFAQEAGIKALESALKRRDISAKVENGQFPGTYRVKYDILGEPLVSIVIPFKDKPELLDMCINSILDKSTYQNYEIIGVSNNSEEKETFEMMEELKTKDKRVSFYEYNVPFNYSDINNHAVNEYAKGEHILLLNNDIEIITPEWIEAMLEFSQREDVGAVGAKLYYPDDSIQHAGVIIGLGGVAGHSHKYFHREATGYFHRLSIVQNLSAVTAACLMVKKTIYDEVGGLNEDDLQIAFNDVDFCLRLVEHGYNNVFTPYCEAYHHESISRGGEDSPEKIKRFQSEIDYMQRRHKAVLYKGDPHYNRNLTISYENFGLK